MQLEETIGLVNDIHSQMQNVQNANKETFTELGTIQSDYSLKLDNYSFSIPKGDYLISLHLIKTLIRCEDDCECGESGCTKIEDEAIVKLLPGHRVACIHAGNEAIVVAIVVSSNEL